MKFQFKHTCSACSSPSSLILSAETYCSEGLPAASHPSNQARKADSSFSCLAKPQPRVTKPSSQPHTPSPGRSLCPSQQMWEFTHFCHWARRFSNKLCFSFALSSTFSYFCCNAVTSWAAFSLLATFRTLAEREARGLLSFSTAWQRS